MFIRFLKVTNFTGTRLSIFGGKVKVPPKREQDDTQHSRLWKDGPVLLRVYLMFLRKSIEDSTKTQWLDGDNIRC
jgi:hypothetical protein